MREDVLKLRELLIERLFYDLGIVETSYLWHDFKALYSKKHPNQGDNFEKKISRSEEHTSELQSHSFISYAVFCLKKKTTQKQ